MHYWLTIEKYKGKILIVAREKRHFKDGKYGINHCWLFIWKKKKEAADSGTASLKHWKKIKSINPQFVSNEKNPSIWRRNKNIFTQKKNWMYLSTADLDYKNIKGSSSGPRE